MSVDRIEVGDLLDDFRRVSGMAKKAAASPEAHAVYTLAAMLLKCSAAVIQRMEGGASLHRDS